MNFNVANTVTILLVLTLAVLLSNGKPTKSADPMAGAVYIFEDGTRVAIEDIPNHIQGTCKLRKATLMFGKNKITADFCGGNCDSRKENCEACQPTLSGKKSVDVQLTNQDGSTSKKTLESITQCECVKLKEC